MHKYGEFKKVKYNSKANIGDEIIINNSYNKSTVRRIVSIAAAFVMMITAGYGVYGYYTPYGYVNVDINPSVELAYNLYNRVIEVKGLNDDGNIIIKDINDYKNKSIDNVINKIVDSAMDHNYISEDKENAVLVTVIEESKKVNEDKIIKSVNAHIEEKKTVAELMVLESKNRPEVKKEENISPGKRLLISKALEGNKKLDYDEVSKKPIKDIIQIVKDNKKDDEKNLKNNKENIIEVRLKCDKCGSTQIVRNGRRNNKSGIINRYLCKECGFRFTDKNGFLKLRKSAAGKEAVVTAENADRAIIYKKIAEQQGTTPAAVGQRRAIQIAERAKKGEWLQNADGDWYQK